MITINPPPADETCEICGKHVSELDPFHEVPPSIQRIVYGNCVIPYKTDDLKLSKTFRSFHEGYGLASWECKDCYTLSDEEAYARMCQMYDAQKKP